MFDLQKRLDTLKTNFEATWQKLEIDLKLADMQSLEEEVAIPEIWNMVSSYIERMKANGAFESRRIRQAEECLKSFIGEL